MKFEFKAINIQWMCDWMLSWIPWLCEILSKYREQHRNRDKNCRDSYSWSFINEINYTADPLLMWTNALAVKFGTLFPFLYTSCSRSIPIKNVMKFWWFIYGDIRWKHIRIWPLKYLQKALHDIFSFYQRKLIKTILFGISGSEK